MSITSMWKKLRNDYVIHQVSRIRIPDFAPDAVCRRRFVFSGRVQKVGFRLEVTELSKRLGLTGFCQNLDNGDVLAELQGPANRIDFLVSFMESLKRIQIRSKTVQELDVLPE